jgi:hypothetical protein
LPHPHPSPTHALARAVARERYVTAQVQADATQLPASRAVAGADSKADRLHPLIPRETERSRTLYRSRGALEREFGRLKHEWALVPLRVRAIERVRLHADLTILAKLSCALARARDSRRSFGAHGDR